MSKGVTKIGKPFNDPREGLTEDGYETLEFYDWLSEEEREEIAEILRKRGLIKDNNKR